MPPATSDDTSLTLLQGLKRADQAAWDRFVDIYGGLIYSWCGRYGASSQDCSDLLQDILLKVSKGISGFSRSDARSTFRGWLRTVSKHTVLDYLRKQQGHRPAVGGEDPTIDLAESIEPAEERAELTMIIERAYNVMRTDFNERWCQAFDLLLDGYTSSEVAEKLGMTPSAVRQANFKIRRRLREELRDMEEWL